MISALVHGYLAVLNVAATNQQFFATNSGGRNPFWCWAARMAAPLHVCKKLLWCAANGVDVRAIDAGLLEVRTVRHWILHLKGL